MAEQLGFVGIPSAPTTAASRYLSTDASLSPCGTYRWMLRRRWALAGPGVVWIMLNPSTADAREDDPTIRRCVGFSRALGAACMTVVNLFAFRATEPDELLDAADPVGEPHNDLTIQSLCAFETRIVCAWGRHKLAARRAAHVLEHVVRRPAFCLGRNADGSPKHPLYLPNGTTLEPYWSPP